jgi:DNA helicase HerA-like ATPase
MVDEADSFAPSARNQVNSGCSARLSQSIVRHGRIRGLGITMNTQRPAVLNKNVLTQAGFAMRHRRRT